MGHSYFSTSFRSQIGVRIPPTNSRLNPEPGHSSWERWRLAGEFRFRSRLAGGTPAFPGGSWRRKKNPQQHCIERKRKLKLRARVESEFTQSPATPGRRNLNGPVLILAGAGTGKTRVITFRVAHLIAKGVAPGNILAVTFTNKAPAKCRSASRGFCRSRSRVESRESRAVTSPSSLDSRPTICTFHSLCVRILRQHIERLGYKRNLSSTTNLSSSAPSKKSSRQISAKGKKPTRRRSWPC